MRQRKTDKRIQYPVCGKEGVPQWQETVAKARGRTPRYKKLHVYHGSKEKPKWCDLRKEHLKALGISKNDLTQNTTNSEKPKLSPKSQKKRAGSLVRIGHEPPKPLGYLDINWDDFREYCDSKYRGSWAGRVVSYAQRYCKLLENPSGLERFRKAKKNNVMSSLVALAKYLGIYEEFKGRLNGCGIRWSSSSSVDSFLRIMGASNQEEDVLEWLEKARGCIGKPSLSLLLKFMALSGLRKAEAIASFNLIVALSQERGGLESYYNRETGALEHYKYSEQFLRTTKNAFITLIPEELLDEIAGYEPVTYEMVRKRLYRRGMRVRIDELRDHWGTFMLDHGLKREEVDLLQGRVGKSIFVRHYWSPALLELRDRVFKALDELKTELA